MSSIFTRHIIGTFSIPRPIKFQETAKSSSKRLNFSEEFCCRKSVSWNVRRRGLRKMKGLEWVRASTTSDGVPAFEQEPFVDESLVLEESGIEATINSLSKWLVSGTFVAFVIWRHDACALWAALGSAINATLSVILKNILNQERPVSTLKSDPGMPSSHAQCIAYFVPFLIISLVERFGVNAFTTSLSGIFVILGSYFAWLRISQRLHTVSQVVVGAILGSIFWFLWIWLWNTFVLNLFVSFFLARIVISLFAIVLNIGITVYSY